MKIEHGRMTIEDTMDNLVENEQGVNCGCEEPKLKMVMHMDFTDKYESQYSCKCGNQIFVSVKRTDEERALWEDN